MRLGANGGPLSLGAAGEFCDFSNLTGWQDAADFWPSSFDAGVLSGGELVCQPVTENTYDTENEDPDTLVGHWLIARETNMADDFEVSVRWRIASGPGHEWLSQVSPVAFVDLEAADATQMGVLPIWDVSISPNGATYVQNAFRSTISDVFNPTYYTNLGGSLAARGFLPTDPGVNWITMRCVSGSLTYYWNGRRRGAAVSVPAWATGRTMMGVHVIGIDYSIGGTYPASVGGATVTQASPLTIDYWSARPLV